MSPRTSSRIGNGSAAPRWPLVRLVFTVITLVVFPSPAGAITWCHDWTIYSVTQQDGNRQGPGDLRNILKDPKWNYKHVLTVTARAKQGVDVTGKLNSGDVTISTAAAGQDKNVSTDLQPGDVIIIGEAHSGVVRDKDGHVDHYLQPAGTPGKPLTPKEAMSQPYFYGGGDWTLTTFFLLERPMGRTADDAGPILYQHPYLNLNIEVWRKATDSTPGVTAPPPAPVTREFQVTPGKWVDTGIALKKGQLYAISGKGECKRPSTGQRWNANGLPNLEYALAARIGGQFIEVGLDIPDVGQYASAPADGTLQLGIPRNAAGDASAADDKIEGGFTATVTYEAPAGGTNPTPSGPGGSVAAAGGTFRDLGAKEIIVACPIRLEVSDAQGRRAAMGADGRIANNIPDTTIEAKPDGNGGYIWYAGFPKGEFNVSFIGTAKGEFHVRTKQHGQAEFAYPAVQTDKDAVASLKLTDDPKPQALRTGSIQDIDPTAVAQTASATGGGTVADGGITVGRNLAIARWHTLRRITKFPRGEEVKYISSTKISSDGSRIAFAASQGFFTIRPDGTGLVRVSEKPCQMMDISANGNRVAWYEGGPDGLFVANADGSGREKMPGGLNLVSLRLTADGSKLFVLVPEKGGIFVLPADGSDVKKIVTTAAVSKILEIDENGNHWRTLDISDDGSRIAFNFLLDLFTANGDGSDLRRVTKYKQYAVSPTGYRLSGDGRRLIHFRLTEPRAMIFADSVGGNETVFLRPPYDEVHKLHPAYDGSRVAASWGVKLYEGDGKTFYDALDTAAHAVHNPYSISLIADFKRAVIQVDGPVSVDQGAPSQLVVVDFNAPLLGGCPAIREITAKPKFMTNDGSTTVTVTAKVDDPEKVQQIGVTFVRNGARDSDYQNFFGLRDDGAAGDEKANDGLFTHNAILCRTNSGKPFPPGQITTRVHVMDKAGNITVVDLEGLEVRQP